MLQQGKRGVFSVSFVRFRDQKSCEMLLTVCVWLWRLHKSVNGTFCFNTWGKHGVEQLRRKGTVWLHVSFTLAALIIENWRLDSEQQNNTSAVVDTSRKQLSVCSERWGRESDVHPPTLWQSPTSYAFKLLILTLQQIRHFVPNRAASPSFGRLLSGFNCVNRNPHSLTTSSLYRLLSRRNLIWF